MIDGHTELVGLIGWPVAHSLSPAMHNAAFAVLGMNWVYVPLPVPPGQVEAAVRGLLALGFRGANVTVPHKQAVMPFMDELGESAQVLGAVNTILVREGRLVGENTDWRGFLDALRAGGFNPGRKRALVLGAGGGARAVIYALVREGAQVSIYNRTPTKAAGLAQGLQKGMSHAKIFLLNAFPSCLDEFDLLVNATPVGMWPESDSSPWPEDVPLPSHLTVFDLVYRPRWTKLLKKARKDGARPIGGMEMLVRQGALAFEMWTGEAPPLEAMRAACEKALMEE
ncbi:MAG: shikimate dehydrogenase [Anaerolineae bacterium]